MVTSIASLQTFQRTPGRFDLLTCAGLCGCRARVVRCRTRLVALPNDFSYATALTRLNISSNRLRDLPLDFGQLFGLQVSTLPKGGTRTGCTSFLITLLPSSRNNHFPLVRFVQLLPGSRRLRNCLVGKTCRRYATNIRWRRVSLASPTIASIGGQILDISCNQLAGLPASVSTLKSLKVRQCSSAKVGGSGNDTRAYT